MARAQTQTSLQDLNTVIDPMRLSTGELEFLIDGDTLDQSPTVAFAEPIPDKYYVQQETVTTGGLIRRNVVCTVNPAAVEPVLETIQKVKQLEAAGRLPGMFVGADVIRAKLQVALDYHRRREAMKRHDQSIGHPSMSAYDSTGRAHPSGVGSDSDRVVTYFDPQGRRHRYDFNLVKAAGGRAGGSSWAVMTAPEPAAEPVVDLPADHASPFDPDQPEVMAWIVSDEENYVQCPVCKHVESWKPGSNISRGHARHRMLRHCASAKDEVGAHRRLAQEPLV